MPLLWFALLIIAQTARSDKSLCMRYHYLYGHLTGCGTIDAGIFRVLWENLCHLSIIRRIELAAEAAMCVLETTHVVALPAQRRSFWVASGAS